MDYNNMTLNELEREAYRTQNHLALAIYREMEAYYADEIEKDHDLYESVKREET